MPESSTSATALGNVPLIWLPLLAATLFSLGALALKRSGHWKIDVWRTTFLSNLFTTVAFVPLWGFGGTLPPWTQWWQPAVTALLFVVGQVCTVLALTRGEVSIAAPILGLKIILVALFSRLLVDRPLPGNIWVSSGLATLGVMVLNAGSRSAGRKYVVLSLTCAAVAAVSFALFDVGVQEWSPRWGLGRFLPVMLGFSALMSCTFIMRFEGRYRDVPRAAWPWLAGGTGLIALQSLTFVCTVAAFGHAAAANVVYSTRGLWSVLLVWLVGPVIGVTDAGMNRRVAVARLAGAGLLLAAIAILLI